MIIITCYHPLKGFCVGLTDNDKPRYIITSYNIDWVCYSKSANRFLKGNGEPPFWAVNAVTDFIEIPCGNCVGCRLKYSREWADRCMLEASYHETNYFVTLTYDNEHLHERSWFDAETGESGVSPTLSKRDLQLFYKRLRKNTGQSLRYYSCGEYGDQTCRPHLHAILFGLRLDDLKFLKKSKHGFNYYTSDTLQKIWTNGFVLICDVSWETCAYVSRYVMKKRKGKTADFYKKFNMEPEFVTMSRRPGIGRLYYDEHKLDIYEHDELIYSTASGGFRSRPPRYFDKLFSEECPELMSEIKGERTALAVGLKEAKLLDCDLSYPELLQREEKAKETQVRFLKREL